MAGGGGGGVVPGQLLYQAEFVEGVGLAAEVALVAGQGEGLAVLAAAAG